MKNQLIILTVLLHLTLCNFAQVSSITATADKNAIVIGEQLILTLKEVVPRGKTASLFALDSLAHFEIINKSKPDSAVTADGISIEQKVTLTSWDSGRWPIPAFAINKAKTKPFFITVSFAPFNAAEPYHDIKDIIEVRKPPESKWWWYLFGLAFLFALFMLFFPKGKKSESPAFVSKPDAYKEALKKLASLKAGINSQEDQVSFTMLIDIFRQYLEKRKNIQSFSKTSEDLIKQLELLGINNSLFTELRSTLQLSDLVKFAQYKSTLTEKELAINTIEKTIEELENKKNAV